jgi:hypothetical protein
LVESFELASSFTIAGVLLGRMGDRAAHRVLSLERSPAVICYSANALLILHVCNVLRFWNSLSNTQTGTS